MASSGQCAIQGLEACHSQSEAVSSGGFSTLCAWREECQDGRTARWKQPGSLSHSLSGGRLSLRVALRSADRDVIEKLCRFQPLRAGMLFADAAEATGFSEIGLSTLFQSQASEIQRPTVHPGGFLSPLVLGVLLFFRETESIGCVRVPNCVSIVEYYSTIKRRKSCHLQQHG